MVIEIDIIVTQMHFLVIKIHFQLIWIYILVFKYNLWEKPVSKLTGESSGT